MSVYGQWEVRLQACNDAGCGPEVSQTVDTVVPAVWLDLSQARDDAGQVRPRTFNATWDPVEGAASYTLRWRRVGTETSSQARGNLETSARQNGDTFGRGTNSPANNQLNLPGDQTSADFTVSNDGRYEANLQANGDGGELIGQGRNEVDPSADQTDTTPPRLERGEINGDTMTVYFSEALDAEAVGGHFRVTLWDIQSGAMFTAEPREVKISGNKVTVVGLGWGGQRARVVNGARLYYYPGPAPITSVMTTWQWRNGELHFRTQEQAPPAGGGPSAATLRDLAGNEVWTPYDAPRRFPYEGPGGFPRTRTIDLRNLTAPPLLQSATAHPRWLTLTFDEALDENSVPAGGAFTVTVNGSAVSLASADPVAVSGDTVTLVLAAPVVSTDLVTVSYAQPSGSPLRGVEDGEARSFPDRSVTNLVGVVPSVSEVAISSVPAANGTYAPGETVQVKLTFTEAVIVTGTPRLKIKLDPSYGEKWVDYGNGSGSTELTFAYTVVEPDRSTRGVAVLRATLDLNGGAIRSVGTGTEAHLWYGGLDHDPDHMVEWLRSAPGVPWVTGVAITSDPGDDDAYALGDTIEVTVAFSETVDVDTTSGTPRLKVRIARHRWWMHTDDAERWADYAGGSGTAELTFNYTVLAENRSTWGVAVLGSGLDLNGGAIRSTAAPPEDAKLRYEGLGDDRNHRVDGRVPALLTVAVAGTTLALTFSEALDENSVPPASAFTVQRTPQGGEEETVSLSGTPAIAAGAVVLTLADPVVGTDTDVKVSYSLPSAADIRLKDRAGNEVAGFTDQAADPTDTTQPRLVWGKTDGNTMTLHFSEALDEDWTGEGDYYRITVVPRGYPPAYGQCDGGIITSTTYPREVYVYGNTAVVVGLGDDETKRASVERTFVNFQYWADFAVAKRLRDLSGNPVSTPIYKWGNYWKTESITLENVTWLPSPERITVVGDQLTLTFDAPLDGGWRPAPGAFTVKVGGSQVNLPSANAVTVAGRKVALTLAAAVSAGDDVTVSYEKPARNWLRNLMCEYAESFSDEPVSNFTGVSRATAAIISDAGDDDTYGRGDVIRVRLTFSEAVKVTGKPGLRLDLNPEGGGERWARYESGSGTNSLIFAHTVSKGNLNLKPDLSTAEGVAVIVNSLGPSGGEIRYVSSGEPAYLAHTGLDHNANHKVDWRR